MATAGIWQTLHSMAEARHETNLGEDHLSKHAVSVLNSFASMEAAESIVAAWGYAFVIPGG